VSTARPASSSAENYLVSVSDLMAGLLFVFLIMLMVFALRFQDAAKQKVTEVNQLKEADRARREVLVSIRNSLKNQGIQVEVDPDNGILRLPENMLFDQGTAVFRQGGVDAMKAIAANLKTFLPRCSKRLEAVLIEGHSDNAPIQGVYSDALATYRDNWDLSFYRAKNTYMALLKNQPALRSYRNGSAQPLLGMGAYGDARPIASNGNDGGRRRNRRIDIRLIIQAPKETTRSQGGEAR
jgi:flagellar motor protein MotB